MGNAHATGHLRLALEDVLRAMEDILDFGDGKYEAFIALPLHLQRHSHTKRSGVEERRTFLQYNSAVLCGVCSAW